MYVSHLGMQFTWWAGYVAHADGRPFVVHLMMTLALLHGGDGGHYAVYLSLQERVRQLTRLWKFVQLGFQLLWLHHILFFERCCGGGKRHVAWWARPQMYDLTLVSACAWGLCILVIGTAFAWCSVPSILMMLMVDVTKGIGMKNHRSLLQPPLLGHCLV